ncbi:thermonuclease family protein [Marinomonas algicola]|uniref:thermonuclease family protein n=1 Tax=Marinomonas algicola TaxID=2773454 RepID=UPI001EFEFF8B|nr:thermonuclease family protein [Marinomonas algicola]
MISLKKRQLCSALFLFLCTSYSHSSCLAEGNIASAEVKRVVDGDTVYFKDGRKVRLIGINTPELDHKFGKHDAYAIEATQALTELSGRTVYYQSGLDKQDRYGRYLYYLFDKHRISISSQLLSKGLGYRIAVPPNTQYQDCLQKSEKQARDKRIGVWGQALQWQPQAGFVIARVTLTSIYRNRGGWWLDTNRNLTINIPQYVMNQWTPQDVYSLAGQLVEARGWQHYRKNKQPDKAKWVWQIKHPNDLIPAE